jgi:hypothetical protein
MRTLTIASAEAPRQERCHMGIFCSKAGGSRKPTLTGLPMGGASPFEAMGRGLAPNDIRSNTCCIDCASARLMRVVLP